MDDIVGRVRQRIESGSPDPMGSAARAPAPAATRASIAADEQTLGFTLPPLLKRLYLEVGNGGWGPGYGLLGLTGGAKDDLGTTAVQSYFSRRQQEAADHTWHWPTGLLPLCHWGCAIYSCIDCAQPSFPMVVFDPNGHDAYNDWSEALFPECEGFDQWIGLWAHGHDLWERLYSDDGVIATTHYERSVKEFTRL